MKVKIKAFASLKDILGAELDIELNETTTMKDLLETLCIDHPMLDAALFDTQRRLREEVTVFVKGRDFDPFKLKWFALEEGDEVALFPPFSGG
jgi:molybdopterin synthase sulfur carrier subunit